MTRRGETNPGPLGYGDEYERCIEQDVEGPRRAVDNAEYIAMCFECMVQQIARHIVDGPDGVEIRRAADTEEFMSAIRRGGPFSQPVVGLWQLAAEVAVARRHEYKATHRPM